MFRSLPRRLAAGTIPTPLGHRPRRARSRSLILALEPLESRRLLSTYVVNNTNDSGAGSLRQAILDSNANPGANNIAFNIPSSDPNFNPVTQDWTITLLSALPTITNPVDIDGFTQANVGIPYQYPANSQPTEITSSANTTAATSGNNAQVRVIVEGSLTSGATGFVLDTSNAILRGLAIDGFNIGVSVPNADDVGDAIQGDYLGQYLVYPVDANSGQPLPSPNAEAVAGQGNAQQGIVVYGTNTTVGGPAPQDDNVIADNGAQGVVLEPGSEGAQVVGNQIGIIGPSSEGLYFKRPNGAQGVLVESSSDRIGAAGEGNLISTNLGDGVAILGAAASQNVVAGNYIGVGPGGGYLLGTIPPGNQGDGVDIQDAPDNVVGGTASGAGNVISANAQDGVSITGSTAVGNVVSGNIIGLTSDGSQMLGNSLQGVAVTSSNTQVGPGNVISANQVGVLISGATVTNVTVIGNLIGTDGSGTNDLGNALQGVLIQGASDNIIEGNGNGSQVISGNNVGIDIEGSTATGNLVEGNLVGTDESGTHVLPNAQQGVLIGNAPGNTIGGTGSAARNVISANYWGVQIQGQTATGNDVLGNLIGTDITGTLPLGNSTDGVNITGASGNTIGGASAGQGNTIAFNSSAGVDLLAGNGGSPLSLGDTILSNSIFSNGRIGISLNGGSNDGIAAPALTAATPDVTSGTTAIQGNYTSQPNSRFLIQFFSVLAADPAGQYEGQTLLGSSIVTTDASGNASFSVGVPTLVTAGYWVTATATYLTTTTPAPTLTQGDSSQFSAPAVQAVNVLIVTSTADTMAIGTLRSAITYSNANPSVSLDVPNRIEFQIPGSGLQTITLLSSLPAITVPVVIDGFSQPGSSTNTSAQVFSVQDTQETDVAVVTVQVDGSQIGGVGTIGLAIAAQDCTVDGLSLTGFTGAAIALQPPATIVAGVPGDTIWGNFIGVTQFNPHSFNPVAASTNIDANGTGIVIDSPNNVVGGSSPSFRNVIEGNTGDGVILYGTQGTGNSLGSNFILDNGGDGVLVLSASNRIGQAVGQGPSGGGNVISGNRGNGVHILGPSAQGNSIVSNEIGTQVGLAGLVFPIRGTQPRTNLGDGVLIENAPSNVVGGEASDDGNVIAGNSLDGVAIENYVSGTVPAIVPALAGIVVNAPAQSGTGNQVQGNDIGFNFRNVQVYAIPNLQDGVNVSSARNFIGGISTGARNIIIDNGENGLDLTSGLPNAQPVNNLVAGNYIGTEDGLGASGNSLDGLLLSGASNNTIGGTAAGAANVISGNPSGVVIQSGSGNLLEGNLIGTTFDGLTALGNAGAGITINGSANDTIGGTVAGAGNLISANSGAGVDLTGIGTTGVVLWGNSIGTDLRGSASLGNGTDGVLIGNGASDNTIGGTAAGQGNTIAGNVGSGIAILAGTGDAILGNSIFANAQGGIVLAGAANDAITAPVLQAAAPNATASTTNVQGSYQSQASSTYLIEFFSNTAADLAGSYEGQTEIGSVTVTTNAAGSATFSVDLPGLVASGLWITARVTYQGTTSGSPTLTPGDSSAFSGAVQAEPVSIQFAAATIPENTPGTAIIQVNRTGNTAGSVTVAFATADGTAVAGTDYAATSGTLLFAPGVTTQFVDVSLLDARIAVGTFSFTVGLSGPTGGATVGSPATTTVNISVDNLPGQFHIYIVDTTADGTTPDGPDSGPLRWAIDQSNANPSPSLSQPNEILFEIPGSGLQTIHLLTPLPPITAPVAIEGYSQPGSQTNNLATSDNATILVQVDGSQIPAASYPDADGLTIAAYNCTVDGLSLTGFSGAGIALESLPTPPPAGALGASIWGNFIGVVQYSSSQDIIVDPSRNPGANRAGLIVASSNNDLGGTLPIGRNLIQGNTGTGVILYGAAATGNLVESDFILDNGGDGVLVLSPNNIIGQPVGAGTAGAGDVISGNGSNGVRILGPSARGNVVANDEIGTSPDGTAARPNQGAGVLIEDAPGNVVGGTGANDRNVIAGNGLDGVVIENFQTGDELASFNVPAEVQGAGIVVDTPPSAGTGNLVQGNWIGYNLTGGVLHLMPNRDGVFISSSGNTIGGTTASAQNIIIANARNGVTISADQLDASNNATGAIPNAQPTLNVIAGNFLGTQGGGDDYGNTLDGILLYAATGNTIGSSVSGSHNVISGNNSGVVLQAGGGNVLTANDIGTTSDGSSILGNATAGIAITNSANNTIGGLTAQAGNVISGNNTGVHLSGAGATGNVLWANLIGTDASGVNPVRNATDGVLIDGGASNNTIGGTQTSAANTIAFNVLDGVRVLAGNGDAILSNSIFSNGQVGIILVGSGNDAIGAPVITQAAPDTGTSTTNIQGTFTAQPNSTFLIQFFSNTAADSGGNYEGQTFIGSTIVRTDASGNVIGNPSGTFSVDVPTVVASGSWITATATYLSTTFLTPSLNHGDTSAFSPGIQAINPFVVTSTAVTDTIGTLVYAINFSNAHPSISLAAPNQITFQIPGSGLQTIELVSPLPAIVQPLIIDGYSQPGSRTNDSSQEAGVFVLDDQETDVAVLNIQIDGEEINGSNINGLTIAAPNCTIDGLIITGFSGAAIAVQPPSSTVTGSIGDTIWGNFLGVTQFSVHSFNPVNPAQNPYANGVGLLIGSSNNLIGGTAPPDRNLIQGNTGDGVIFYGSQGTRNTLASNFILDNGGDGVLALSANNQIGEATVAGEGGAGNVISGNLGNGVHILGPAARGNVVASNEIGTQVGLSGLVVPIRGTQPRPNGGAGVLIENAPVNVIGGQLPNAGNVIAGNTLDGVVIENYVSGTVPAIVPVQAGLAVNSPLTAATSNQVQGNSIGFNFRNLQVYPIPNRDGVFLASSGNLVGGDSSAARNVIVDNNRNGVTISADQLDNQDNATAAIPDAQPSSNLVEGNYIGTQAGNNDNGNALDGILLFGASNNTIGGTASGAGNVISANTSGIVIQAATSTANVVAGNTIGLTADGSAPLGNVSDGVAILDSPGNVLGGTLAGAGNIIAGNGNGVDLSGSAATGNALWGNLIGTNSQGGDLLGNSKDGVLVDNGASDNLIGQSTRSIGAGNTIAFNAGTGVAVLSGTGNSILSNSIDSNSQLGIVLSSTGNDGQTAPTVTAAVPSTASTIIQGNLASTPATAFLIQFFSNASGDPSGFGQGQTLIGSTTVTTNGSGAAVFNAVLTTVITPGLIVTATATNLATGDTSAFSNDALSQPIVVQFSTSAYAASPTAGSATISVLRTGNVNATFTVSYATSDGTAVAGVNYTATAGVLSFGLGQTVGIFTVPLSTSTPPSGTLTVNLGLSNPTGGATLGSPSAAVLSIVDTRPIVVQFSASTYVVTEPATSAVITVTRNTPSGSASVSYTASPGTAVPNSDFTPVSGLLAFNPDQTTQTFVVPISSTLLQSGQRTVLLTLSGPTGAALGTPSTATLIISAPAGAVQFSTAALNVAAAADQASITVDRVYGSSGTVTVGYTVSAGQAIPGVDFTPTSGTLTFAPGVNQQSFIIPFPNAYQDPYDATVILSLSNPTGGAGLASPSTETVTILKPLVVASEQLVTSGTGIAAVTLTFNKPLNPARAQDLGNYGYFVYGSTAGSSPIPLQSAVYNPSNLSVTLTPAATLALNRSYQITIDGQATPLLNNGITDVYANQLTGSNGTAGTPMVMTFSAGPRLTYTDAARNVVSLRLSRGLIELFQAPGGAVQQVELVGTVPGRSTLTGSVRRGRGGTGRTVLPPITGASGVRIRLKSPPFILLKTPIALEVAQAVPAVRTVRHDAGAAVPFGRRRWRR